jgi:hypothetical protein
LGKPSRDKGRLGEQQVATIFRDAGYTCHRVANSGGLCLKGDLTGIDGFHVEVKRQERLDIPKWLRQVREETPEGDVPLLIFRRSREDWQVVIPLDELIELMT